MHILPRLPFSYPIIVLRARSRRRDWPNFWSTA